ncbi:MAG: hypothetical protein LBG89_00820 [Rickettsiales bacterium]|jgi:hypothetical protein|nr:hypothetical protein [Rickettsiales bacterium]
MNISYGEALTMSSEEQAALKRFDEISRRDIKDGFPGVLSEDSLDSLGKSADKDAFPEFLSGEKRDVVRFAALAELRTPWQRG